MNMYRLTLDLFIRMCMTEKEYLQKIGHFVDTSIDYKNGSNICIITFWERNNFFRIEYNSVTCKVSTQEDDDCELIDALLFIGRKLQGK